MCSGEETRWQSAAWSVIDLGSTLLAEASKQLAQTQAHEETAKVIHVVSRLISLPSTVLISLSTSGDVSQLATAVQLLVGCSDVSQLAAALELPSRTQYQHCVWTYVCGTRAEQKCPCVSLSAHVGLSCNPEVHGRAVRVLCWDN